MLEALGSKIKSIDELERRILSYNLKQWEFGGLKAYVEELENEEKKYVA